MYVYIYNIILITLLLLDIEAVGCAQLRTTRGIYLVLKLFYLCPYLYIFVHTIIHEPRREKTCLRGLRPGPTQTELEIHRR